MSKALYADFTMENPLPNRLRTKSLSEFDVTSESIKKAKLKTEIILKSHEHAIRISPLATLCRRLK